MVSASLDCSFFTSSVLSYVYLFRKRVVLTKFNIHVFIEQHHFINMRNKCKVKTRFVNYKKGALDS